MKKATPVATIISKMITPNAVIVSTDGVDEPSLAKLISARRGAALKMQSKTPVAVKFTAFLHAVKKVIDLVFS